jgi:hypothetical protein
MTGATDNERFSLSCRHQLHPCWPFSSSFSFQVCKFPDVMDFQICGGLTEFTHVCQKSLKDFCACVDRLWQLVEYDCFGLRDQWYSPKLRNEWSLSLACYHDL